jgi:hypothetical protein
MTAARSAFLAAAGRLWGPLTRLLLCVKAKTKGRAKRRPLNAGTARNGSADRFLVDPLD